MNITVVNKGIDVLDMYVQTIKEQAEVLKNFYPNQLGGKEFKVYYREVTDVRRNVGRDANEVYVVKSFKPYAEAFSNRGLIVKGFESTLEEYIENILTHSLNGDEYFLIERDTPYSTQKVLDGNKLMEFGALTTYVLAKVNNKGVLTYYSACLSLLAEDLLTAEETAEKEKEYGVLTVAEYSRYGVPLGYYQNFELKGKQYKDLLVVNASPEMIYDKIMLEPQLTESEVYLESPKAFKKATIKGYTTEGVVEQEATDLYNTPYEGTLYVEDTLEYLKALNSTNSCILVDKKGQMYYSLRPHTLFDHDEVRATFGTLEFK